MSGLGIFAPIVDAYRALLTPIPPFTWFDLSLSTLDVVATARLCLIMRQLRVGAHNEHLAKRSAGGVSKDPEASSLVKDVVATLVVVYGGEAVVCPFLNIPPSFMLSGTVPLLYTSIQVLVEYLPWLPSFILETELPLAFIDALTRTFLLCSLIPPPILAHAVPAVAQSPWTLLLSSFMLANTGFFVVNTLSMLNPAGWNLATPPELLPYGWSTTDLWCAPLVTGVYALLTHAQPFWADLHTTIAVALGATVVSETTASLTQPENDSFFTKLASFGSPFGSSGNPEPLSSDPTVAPLDPELARAICAAILASMFATRAVKNFGREWLQRWKTARQKKGVPRSKVDGKKYAGPKVKSQ